MATLKSRSYKDIDLSFRPNPVTGDLNVIKNERAIVRAVRNLVQTGLKERFYSDVGSDITNNLFGFVDFATGGVIATQVLDLITVFEPRVTNVKVEADPRPDNNAFEVIIAFDIIGEPTPTTSFSFLLEATR